MRIKLILLLAISFQYTLGYTQYQVALTDSGKIYFEQLATEYRSIDTANIDASMKREKLYQLTKSFVLKHPNNQISAQFIGFSTRLTYQQVDTLYQLLDPNLKNVPANDYNLKNVLKRLTIAENGRPFPKLILKDTSGNEIDIVNYKGKVVLIEFWASWCIPCRHEMPILEKVYDKYRSKGFEILAVSFDDDRKKWLKAIYQDKQPWKNFSELKTWAYNVIALRFGLGAIPYNFLIDENGMLVNQGIQAHNLDKELKKLLEK